MPPNACGDRTCCTCCCVQVKTLCSLACGGVPATYLSSQQTKGDAAAVYRELQKDTPSCKLLYVTPEQLVKSERLRGVLQCLHQRGLFARIVVDEARSVFLETAPRFQSCQWMVVSAACCRLC